MALPQMRCSSHREQRERCSQLRFLKGDSPRPQHSRHPLSHAHPVRAPQVKVRQLSRIAFQGDVDACPKRLSPRSLSGYLAEAHQRRFPRIMSTSNDGLGKALCPIITKPHKLAYFPQRARVGLFMKEQAWERWSTTRR